MAKAHNVKAVEILPGERCVRITFRDEWQAEISAWRLAGWDARITIARADDCGNAVVGSNGGTSTVTGPLARARCILWTFCPAIASYIAPPTLETTDA